MSYKKATHILPADLLEQVQEYIDGECIYIPRASGSRKKWGMKTSIREELRIRNEQIFKDYLTGYSSDCLTEKYYLSLKSIQRIIRQQKKND